MPLLATNKTCTGCLSCVDTCSHGAIEIKKQHELLYPFVNKEKCIGCNLCEKSCPIVTPVPLNKVENIRVFGGWAVDETMRVNGASGGACSALSQSFIKQYSGNVAVYGATLEENRVYHKRITCVNDLYNLSNSKYIQSDTSGVFKQVHEDLKNGLHVMFTGTPCQIAGLYGYLRTKHLCKDRLMTIELICAGVMSPEALDLHLIHNHSPEIVSFRNKVEGQFVLKSQCTTIIKDGQPFRFTKRGEDLFYRCFSSSILERYSCHDCQFAKLTRVADFTVGDFWGGNRETKEYEKGVNVILANNSRAVEFINNSQELKIYASTIAKAISGNPCLFNGFKFIKYHPLVMWPDLSRRFLSRKVWINIVANQNPWRYLWGCYRLLSKINIYRKSRLINKKYSQIINEWYDGKKY